MIATMIRAFNRAMREDRVEDAQAILGELTLPRMGARDIAEYHADPHSNGVSDTLVTLFMFVD
jgi:hypothetical protein